MDIICIMLLALAIAGIVTTPAIIIAMFVEWCIKTEGVRWPWLTRLGRPKRPWHKKRAFNVQVERSR